MGGQGGQCPDGPGGGGGGNQNESKNTIGLGAPHCSEGLATPVIYLFIYLFIYLRTDVIFISSLSVIYYFMY